VAEAHNAVLLHYDRHFDQIVRVTGQPAEWLAPRGSLS
jgi:predicted nucleic acid-binding protein